MYWRPATWTGMAAYVGLTRHREAVSLHYSRGDFATPADLARVLGREREKDVTLDYRGAFAGRRGVERGEANLRAREHGRPLGQLEREWERSRGRDRDRER
jgi:hypothetical protein